MLWQFWCHCNPDHDKFSFTVVAVFPNVCLWRRSLCSNLENCLEPTSYASTAYVVAIWPSFLFDYFVKIWDTCENFLGKWFTAPPGKKFPLRLCLAPHGYHPISSSCCISVKTLKSLVNIKGNLILIGETNRSRFITKMPNHVSVSDEISKFALHHTLKCWEISNYQFLTCQIEFLSDPDNSDTR